MRAPGQNIGAEQIQRHARSSSTTAATSAKHRDQGSQRAGIGEDCTPMFLASKKKTRKQWHQTTTITTMDSEKKKDSIGNQTANYQQNKNNKASNSKARTQTDIKEKGQIGQTHRQTKQRGQKKKKR